MTHGNILRSKKRLRVQILGEGEVFSADVEELFYFGDDGAGLVFDFDGEEALDLFFGG